MKNTKPKVRLWSVLTGLTAILTVAAIVGNIIANQYATTINVALNASTYKIIHGENTGDTEYFKKGFASDEEREAPALSIPARLPTSSRLWKLRASPSTRPCGTCTALTP